MPKLDTIIKIKAKPEKGERRKGVLRPRREGEVFRRRKRGGIYLRMFDLGQYADGTERPFVLDLPNDPLTFYPWNSFDLTRRGYDPPRMPLEETAHRDDYNAFLLEGDRSTWTTVYREFFKGTAPQTTSIGSPTYTPGKGYLVQEGENGGHLAFISPLAVLWYAFTTGNPAFYKVTREPEFSAPAAPFYMNGSCDAFLVPALRLWEGRAGTWDYTLPGWPTPTWRAYYRTYIYYTAHFVKPIPRSVGINSPQFSELMSIPPSLSNVLRVGLSDSLKTWMQGVFAGQAESAASRIDVPAWVAAGPSANVNDFVTPISAGDFPSSLDTGLTFAPISPYITLDIAEQMSWLDAPMLRWWLWYRRAGSLAGVIHKKAGTDPGWYYVWTTFDQLPPVGPAPGTIDAYGWASKSDIGSGGGDIAARV